MLPYGRQSISDEDIEAVTDALRGDWLTTGPAVGQFEEALSLETGGHQVVTTNSGTSALHAAYAGLGISAGDEVITTPMTFVATASVATMVGAKVVFADIGEDPLIDPQAVTSLISQRTRAVVAVDYAGHPCAYDDLRRAISGSAASLVADAAHSIGSTQDGRPVGDLADVTTLSFFPTKNMTTAEGGAVVARDPEVAARARRFRSLGLVRDPEQFSIKTEGAWHQEVHEFGLNYRLTDIACRLGLSQIARLAQFKARRQAVFDRYDAMLADLTGIDRPRVLPGNSPVWHLYSVRVKDGRRREVFDKMRAQGIGVQVNYIPAYWHPAYAHLGYQRGLCPRAEDFYAEQLSLPLYPDLTPGDVDHVVEALELSLR